jgi:hypothetical protein
MMKSLWPMALLATAMAIAPAHADSAKQSKLQSMPETLEMQFALSALPPALRENATVQVLDPDKGYRVAREGTSGVTCIVERTAWELADFRDDIYIPLCYDAAGTKTYLKAIMDAATLRARGIGPDALKTEMEKRFREGTYLAPEKAGVSYMVAPVMRTVGPPDLKVHTMAMPHLMFYAPGITNEDLGAKPDLADPSSLRYPFIDRQGIAEQSYMIQLIGDTEKARILVDEKPLIDGLCAYREVLCLSRDAHPGH